MIGEQMAWSMEDRRVLAAMRSVPRGDCVPVGPVYLPTRTGLSAIGHGHAISQPHIVALIR
jgi:protein-L-isoaspartate O-methyltransferase